MTARWMAVVVGGALALTAGCKDKVAEQTLGPRELPGFRIALPAGERMMEQTTDYDAGKVIVAFVAREDRSVAGVTWGEGGMLEDPEAEQMLVGALGAVFGELTKMHIARTTAATVEGGLRAHTLELEGDMTMLLTLIECGRRTVVVMNGGKHGDHRALHARTLASFRCTPDPAQEAKGPTRPPVVLDAPGWTSVDPDPAQTGWARGDEVLLFSFVPGGSPEAIAPMIEGLFTSQGGTASIARIADVDGHPVWQGSVSFDGITVTLVGIHFPCGARGVLGIYLGTVPDDGRALLAAARCER